MESRGKRKVTKLVTAFDMAHMVVVGTPLDHRKQEHARAQCMERLLWELGQLEVTQVFLEQRTQSLNNRDMKLVRYLRGKKSIPSSIRVDIALPSTEPMLWIPDQVLGGMGDAEAHETVWLDQCQGAIERIDITIQTARRPGPAKHGGPGPYFSPTRRRRAVSGLLTVWSNVDHF